MYLTLHVSIFLVQFVPYFVAGDGPSAAYRRWEKGAIDGVSLVADAAEHLERAEAGKEAELDQNALGESFSSYISCIFLTAVENSK